MPMKGSGGRRALALALPLLVIPLAGLAYLALRSVDQQEGEMRNRLRESLLLEVAQTNARIGAWFADLPDSLGEDAPPGEGSDSPTAAELAEWKDRQPLVGIPFLLDSSGAIRLPEDNPEDEEIRRFYWRYLRVFGNQESIPVYRNIAAEYESSIVMGQAEKTAYAEKSADAEAEAYKNASPDTDTDAAAPLAAAPLASSPQLAENLAAENLLAESLTSAPSAPSVSSAAPESLETEIRGSSFGVQAPEESSFSSLSRKKEVSPSARSKVAQSIFETDAAVQRQVYELAAEEGKSTLTRRVNPQIDASNTRDSLPPRSVYIESDSYFRDLVSRSDRGIVPRVFDNTLVLLYWEKRGDWIVGCELDMGAVRAAIAERSGNPADSVRYLAVLDQGGDPVVPVPGLESAAWRTPLVSSEISEYLPYWETAVILSNPDAFEVRIRSSRYALSVLIALFFLSVAAGAALLWRHSADRLLEARRRTSFVTTVSHELKTPLTSIRMYSEMLAEGADLDREKRDRYLARIVGESERLSRLIGDVLDVAKLERGRLKLNPVPMDLAALAREGLENSADRLKASGFALSFSAPEGPVMALADRDAVLRILVNFISNAEKYSAQERVVEVGVSRSKDGRRVSVSVADRGIGVPRGKRKKIFREFFRIDSGIDAERGGTGLGLSIARSLARSLGGDVTYAPRTRGSVFTLWVPAASGEETPQ